MTEKKYAVEVKRITFTPVGLFAVIIVAMLIAIGVMLSIEYYKEQDIKQAQEKARYSIDIASSVEKHILDYLSAPDSLKQDKKEAYARYIDSLINPNKYKLSLGREGNINK